MSFATIFLIVLRNLELAVRDLFGMSYRPYKLLLELTEHCNSRCKTCHIWMNTGEKKHELSPSDLKLSLRDYGQNLLWIALGGGEPTIYSRMDELLEVLTEACPNLRILALTTNGLEPAKVLELAQKLQAKGVELFVTISLDGDESTHDHLRGISGNYALAQQTFRLLKEQGIWTHFGFTLSKLNSKYVADSKASNFANIRAFSFEHIGGIYKTKLGTPNLNIAEGIEKIKSLYRIERLTDVVESIYLKLAFRFFKSERKGLPIPCEVVSTNLHIRPNGEIVPCMYLPAIGNIGANTLREVLATPEARSSHRRATNGNCDKCWMNCYAPHSIMRHPLKSIRRSIFQPSSTGP